MPPDDSTTSAPFDPPVRLSLPLQYQQDLFHTLRADDALLIMARGLGLLHLLSNLLHAYDAAGHHLILLINATERENSWLGEALAEHAAVSGSPKCRGLQLVNTEQMSVGAREKLYAGGGIFSITSRILIVDFLSGLLNPSSVSGIVALHAENVGATSAEAFILRVYRQQNKKGFLKAFSDSPEGLAGKWSGLKMALGNLFLRQPIIYPRFHEEVARDLEGKKKAEVIELEVPMTENMKEIQAAVLECVDASIKDLKKANTTLELEDWNIDSAMGRSFDVTVRRQLDPVWHRVSFRTKILVRDLTLLRNILNQLLTQDAIAFNQYLDTVRAASAPPPGNTRQEQSPWLSTDASHTLFEAAKRRVYTGKITDSTSADKDGLNPVLEELPKWHLLAEVLDEIEELNYFNPQPHDESSGSILIMCSDAATCRQLREYLQTMDASDFEKNGNGDGDDLEGKKRSGNMMMRRKLRNYLSWKRNFSRVSNSLFAKNQEAISGSTSNSGGAGNRGGRGPPNKRRRVRGGAAGGMAPGRNANGSLNVPGDKDAHIQALMQDLTPNENENGNEATSKTETGADPLVDMEDYFELYELKDLVVVHPYDGDMDDHLLNEIKPRYVIMYEPDTAFIRRIEVYRSSHINRQIRVYFMYYEKSVEEQRFLTAMRREKDAFTNLISERGKMSLTITHDTANLDPQESFLRTVNTRIAGGGRLAATAEPPRVVVDLREFRSSLASLLHGSNNVVVPCQLTVGDYVLTPDICVERKSIKDLISSFQTGRLYHQAETMLAHYPSPFLLIEFDAHKAFTLEPFADLPNHNSSTSFNKDSNTAFSDLQSKLVLLTISFPKLKILWSSSPHQTATLFAELKKGQPEPDPHRAVQLGLEDSSDSSNPLEAARTFNATPQDMLRAVPGVNAKVLERLVLEFDDLQAVANAGEELLAALVGREAARGIGGFFARSVWDEGGGGD